MQPSILSDLCSTFGDRLQENVPLSGYTAARIGGPADALVFVRSADELADAAEKLWKMDVPFLLLGGGSNVLVSDKGVRGVVIINRARLVKFDLRAEPPSVHAESGVTPNDITQRAARLGLAGFEWAAGVPGSLGGAVYGNAGAFDGDIAGNLISLELIHRQNGRQVWPVEKMEYGYRTSVLKREHPPALILSAQLALSHGDPQTIRAKMEQFSEQRRNTQPPGASMGSMFKNPTGEKAGRLIEDAGLKGRRIGNAEISTQHANFFINHGQTRAEDIKALIELARISVAEKFGVKLELEVELIGEW
ncbi:MAG: UDP-N-acetylmuramate dehydrogenase [Chloroflexi bacterium]|jgi:UDP-N-acetylmuramate dehydrogenase|nr:UDP-N-acetylmuramate dehydrogenase [Chloroflexota bacterium]